MGRKVVPLFGPELRAGVYAPSFMEEPDKSPIAQAAQAHDDRLEIFTLGEFTLDRRTGELSRAGETANLQPSTLGVLGYLMDHPNQVVSADELITAVWPDRIIGDDAVHRRIADIRKQLGDDARRPRYVETLPRRGYRLIAPVSAAPVTPADDSRSRLRRYWPGLLAASLVLLLGGAIFWFQQSELAEKDRLERIAAFVDAGDGFSTFLELLRVEERDATLEVLTASVVASGRIETEPSGADVWLQWRPGERWHHAGTTPFQADFPKGIFSIRLEKSGYATRTLVEANPGLAFNNAEVPHEEDAEPSYRLKMLPAEQVEPGTVFVQGGNFRTPFIMTRDRYLLDDFLIDEHEVSNAEFKAFMDDGGYHRPELWDSYPAFDSDPPADRFLDSTGSTGPAAWEFGGYPTGKEDYPVAGVSWFEATAYARWAGRQLPTILDWGRAALSPVEWVHPIAPLVVETANLDRGQTQPVGMQGKLSASGATDLIGNVREWTSSEFPGRAVLVGGGFDSHREQPAFPLRKDPYDRSLQNGFRCVTYLGDRNAVLATSFDWKLNRPELREPISDEAFEGISAMFSYEEGAVGFDDAKVIRRTDEGDWERWLIELPTVVPGDPLPLQVFLPEEVEPPYQPVFFAPPSSSFGPSLASADIRLEDYYLDVVVRSGRALIWPVYTGTHERYGGGWSLEDDASFAAGAIRNQARRRDEVGRIIDYLAANPEFDASAIGFIALGFGATYTVPSILALEQRITAAVLWNPLYPHGFLRPAFDPATFWPRVQQPVLAANGTEDSFEWDMDPNLLMEMIGTPTENKVLRVYEGPHWPLPRQELLIETIAWLDRYLGKPGVSETPVTDSSIAE